MVKRKDIKIGVLGTGSFADSFISLFNAHPLVKEVVLCDVNKNILNEKVKKYKISRKFSSLDDLCLSDVDAVAVFTNRWKHGSHSLQALKAGKHVYSAVPAGITTKEISALIDIVQKSGLLFMTGETSYYYPCTIYCRERFKKGDFGKFVYGEGEYYHDFEHGFYKVFQREGSDWKKHAGIPPMLYPTHSVSMILSVTGSRITDVSCLGFKDSHEDGLFKKDVNIWNNIYSNQTALCRTADGGICRINEFRRVGIPSRVSTSIYGTLGSYEEQTESKVWCNKNLGETQDITNILACNKISINERDAQELGQTLAADFFSGVSKVHNVERLPIEFKGMQNGHSGSHQFLVDDFIRALSEDVIPPNNIWDSARYCLPGIIANESSRQNGKMLKVPDFGDAPSVTIFK